MIINGLITMLCGVKFPVGICARSLNGGKFRFEFVRGEWDDGINVWQDEDIDPPWAVTPQCYDAKGNCGDVDQLITCFNDLENCYSAAFLENPTPLFNMTVPQNFLMSQLNGAPHSTIWNGTTFENPTGFISRTAWLYNMPPGSNWGDLSGSSRRVRFKSNVLGNDRAGSNACTKCSLGTTCDDDELKFLGSCWRLKKKCLFSGLLCKNCGPSCPDGVPHSCCPGNEYGCPDNSASCGNDSGCCCDCCIKIPLIPLKCADENKTWLITTLIPTPFAPGKCNRNFVAPYSCKSCGGLQTPGVKDWVSCILEPLAVWLRMLKFDFYNDWVGGTLYFPLVKRKYKLKKSKRKFGQIKKDKFCDFDCRERGSDDNFQGNPTYKQWRIKIPSFPFSNPTIEFQGCTSKLKGKRVTDWYGTLENDLQSPNLDLAVNDFNFHGTDSNGDGCNIKFNTFLDFQTTFNNLGINFNIKDHKVFTEHGKPEYIEIEDSNGNTSWKNIGGHGHIRNICDSTRLIERKEYFKTTLDCEGVPSEADLEGITSDGIGQPSEVESEDDGEFVGECDGGTCPNLNCDNDCGTNGVAPCKKTNVSEINNYNDNVITHGLISWNEQEIYYTPRIMSNVGDDKFNEDEYKGNLLLPTTIMELGSSVYCDIDDVPFIMDQLEPTTFNVSFEDTKYRSNITNTTYSGPDGFSSTADDGVLRTFTKFDDKKESSLNLRAYVEFGCTSVICTNTLATVNQSQIGVDMVDKNDIGVEIGNCFVRFDHDADIRSYFCRRFNGFKGNSSFHHTRPGSIEFDNSYETYPEITLSDGFNLYYEMPETGEIVKSEYNDGDSFIPGDACGYNSDKGSIDYFYGLAPGQTSSFINYPNADTSGGDNGTINFGTSHPDGIDEIFNPVTFEDDINNGASNINGIRFNRSQTPYHLYFGLVPGKTALQKTVGKFFADKISAVTLEGIGSSNDSVSENINNTPNLNNPENNPFTVYKTCLGETLIQNVTPDSNQTTGPGGNPTTGGGSSGPSTGGSIGIDPPAG